MTVADLQAALVEVEAKLVVAEKAVTDIHDQIVALKKHHDLAAKEISRLATLREALLRADPTRRRMVLKA